MFNYINKIFKFNKNQYSFNKEYPFNKEYRDAYRKVWINNLKDNY